MEKGCQLSSHARHKTKVHTTGAFYLISFKVVSSLYSGTRSSLFQGHQFSLLNRSLSQSLSNNLIPQMTLSSKEHQGELSTPQGGPANGKETGRKSPQTHFQHSWFLTPAHSSVGHVFSLLLLIPKAWVLQNLALKSSAFIFSEASGREKCTYFRNCLHGEIIAISPRERVVQMLKLYIWTLIIFLISPQKAVFALLIKMICFWFPMSIIFQVAMFYSY